MHRDQSKSRRKMWSNLHSAVLNDNVNEVLAILHDGFDPNCQVEDDDAPLHVAAREGVDINIVIALLDAGAAIDIIDDIGNTPLHYAVINEHAEIVTVLISAGADPHCENIFKLSPYEIAKNLYPNMFRLLC